MLTGFVQLFVAIGCEIVGTTALRASAGFTRVLPILVVCLSYLTSFYFMSQCLRFIPLGVAYATWSGLGTIGIVTLGVLIWNEQITLWRVLGIVLIVAGVIMVAPHHESV